MRCVLGAGAGTAGKGRGAGREGGNGEVRADSGGTIFAGVSYDACPGGSRSPLPATPISIVGARTRDEYRPPTLRRPRVHKLTNCRTARAGGGGELRETRGKGGSVRCR